MKRLLTLLLPFVASAAFAGGMNIDPNQSGAVVVGTSASAPTRFFSPDMAATKTCLVNISTNPVYVVGYSTTSYLQQATPATLSISVSTGSFYLPAAASGIQPQPVCFDGADGPFAGPLWGAAATGGNVVLKLRTH